MHVSLICSVCQHEFAEVRHVTGMGISLIPTDYIHCSYFNFFNYTSVLYTVTLFVCANVLQMQKEISYWMKTQNCELNSLLYSVNTGLYVADFTHVSFNREVCPIFSHSLIYAWFFEQKFVTKQSWTLVSINAHHRPSNNAHCRNLCRSLQVVAQPVPTRNGMVGPRIVSTLSVRVCKCECITIPKISRRK